MTQQSLWKEIKAWIHPSVLSQRKITMENPSTVLPEHLVKKQTVLLLKQNYQELVMPEVSASVTVIDWGWLTQATLEDKGQAALPDCCFHPPAFCWGLTCFRMNRIRQQISLKNDHHPEITGLLWWGIFSSFGMVLAAWCHITTSTRSCIQSLPQLQSCEKPPLSS